jgi:hypothetical protein
LENAYFIPVGEDAIPLGDFIVDYKKSVIAFERQVGIFFTQLQAELFNRGAVDQIDLIPVDTAVDLKKAGKFDDDMHDARIGQAPPTGAVGGSLPDVL